MALGEWDSAATIHASRPDVRLKVEEPESPGFLEVMGAAARQSNSFGSFVASNTGDLDPWEVDEGFNTLDYVRKTYGDDFEAAYGDRFLDVFNRRYADALKRQIDMETEDKKTLAAADFGGMLAEMLFGALDPTNLLPGGQAVRTVKTGRAMLSSAARVGLAGAGSAALSEGALQMSQETRTLEESALAIGGSTFLSAMVGTTFGVRS
jgi:hypothetical protein